MAENAAKAEPERFRVAKSTAGVAFRKVWLLKMLQGPSQIGLGLPKVLHE